ncbi:MAG TPA: metal-dependent hydrolase [Vicinamibacterales bacterium]|nr:metal-dependent hydrolase [Vicinamibacterales bacterium]
MPSPVGHALGAIAAAWAVAPPDSPAAPATGGTIAARRPALVRAGLVVGVALIPDLDLLIGAHSQWTHSIGAVAIVFAAAWLLTGRRVRLAAALALAYATHPFLDWLGQDGTPPYGIMALWPFSDRYYHSGADLFTGISRRYWLPGFIGHNLGAIAREVLLIGPVTLAVWYARGRKG